MGPSCAAGGTSAGAPAVQLPELLEIFHGQVVAGKVQHNVLQRAGVAIGQHEAIPIRLSQQRA